MIVITDIQRKLFSILLVLAFTLPSWVQLAHSLEGHEHKECKEASTHLHTQEFDCSIDQFHLSVFNYETAPQIQESWVAISTTYNSYYTSHYSNQYWIGNYQRGPPYIF